MFSPFISYNLVNRFTTAHVFRTSVKARAPDRRLAFRLCARLGYLILKLICKLVKVETFDFVFTKWLKSFRSVVESPTESRYLD